MRQVALNLEDIADAILAGIGTAATPLDPCANSYEFVKKYALRFDGINLADGLDGDYRHLKDWYEDEHPMQVAMASAQSGKTARLITHLVRAAVGKCYGRSIGYYFPDIHLPLAFSKSRLRPMLRSNPALSKLVGAKREHGEKGTDALLTMTIGTTTLFLMTIGGKSTTEGLPLPAVYFDEVRRMARGDIERAQKRYSEQKDPIDVKVSTARYPNADIHKYFLEGDQRYFHTACSCPDGVILSTTFPSCIADLRTATPAFIRKVQHAYAMRGIPYLGMSESDVAKYPASAYHCPTCGDILVDPREGWWEPHAPRNWIHSYQLPKMLSVLSPAGRILSEWEKSEDRQEFFNSELGLPYLDREAMPLQPEHVDACVDRDLRWGEHLGDAERRKKLTNCAAGMDVQKGYGILVIKRRMPNGKARVVHLEVVRDPKVENKTWWHRAGVLMRRYDVRCMVVDSAPEFTAVLQFQQAFPGRVFLADYTLGDNAPRFVAWADRQLGNDDKQRGDTATRWRVQMHRARALHWSLMRWKERATEVPDLRTLMQSLPHQGAAPFFSAHLQVGTESPASIGLVLRDHLTQFLFKNVAVEDATTPKAVQKVERRGLTKYVAEHVCDYSPDFAHADLYASVALDRMGTPSRDE